MTWTVSADGYVSQTGSLVMNGNKKISVNLNPDTVSFTVTSNVAATITINGSVSSGVTSKTVTVTKGSNVTWSVSASGYDTQNGVENNVLSDVTVPVTLILSTASISVRLTCSSYYVPPKGIGGPKYKIEGAKMIVNVRSDDYSWASTEKYEFLVTETGSVSCVFHEIPIGIVAVCELSHRVVNKAGYESQNSYMAISYIPSQGTRTEQYFYPDGGSPIAIGFADTKSGISSFSISFNYDLGQPSANS